VTTKPSAAAALASQPKSKNSGRRPTPHAKSPLRLWIEEELGDRLDEITSPTRLAEYMAAHGFTDENGNRPTVGAVYSTLKRIRIDRANKGT